MGVRGIMGKRGCDVESYLAEQFSWGGGLPSNPRALACLVPRDSELAFLLRSLIKRSPPPSSRNSPWSRPLVRAKCPDWRRYAYNVQAKCNNGHRNGDAHLGGAGCIESVESKFVSARVLVRDRHPS